VTGEDAWTLRPSRTGVAALVLPLSASAKASMPTGITSGRFGFVGRQGTAVNVPGNDTRDTSSDTRGEAPRVGAARIITHLGRLKSHPVMGVDVVRR
jgi:hypothetical protein